MEGNCSGRRELQQRVGVGTHPKQALHEQREIRFSVCITES